MSIKLEARFHAWADTKRNILYVVTGWRRRQSKLLKSIQYSETRPINLWGEACEFARDTVETAFELLHGDDMEVDYDIETRIWMNMPPEGMHGLDEGDCVIGCAEQNICANGGILSQEIELYTVEDGRRLYIFPPRDKPKPLATTPIDRDLAVSLLREAADDGV